MALKIGCHIVGAALVAALPDHERTAHRQACLDLAERISPSMPPILKILIRNSSH